MASSSIPVTPVPIRAHLSSKKFSKQQLHVVIDVDEETGIEVVGDLEKSSQNKHFIVLLVDKKEILRSEKQNSGSTTQWEWPEEREFVVHPSSTINIKIYRKSRTRVVNHFVGEYTGIIVESLQNDKSMDLKDKDGSVILPKIKIALAIRSEDTFETFMNTVSDDISRIDGTGRAPILSAIGAAFQLTKNIMDVVSNAHSILKTSWAIMSAVYVAIQQTDLVDDTVKDLCESLREMLGAAKECPDLLVIEGTANVIEEIGRTSLMVSSLIHEYTRRRFAGRVITINFSNNIKFRITQCQKSCNDLKEKFDRRLNMEVKLTVRENGMMMRETFKVIKDHNLSDKIQAWLSAPDSSRNFNEARKKHQAGTCDWFLEGTRFREFQEKSEFLWMKGTAGCGKTILCSSIIARLIELCKKQKNSAIAYFLFDGRDSQKQLQLHDNFIRSLILQLSLQSSSILSPLVDLYGHGHQQPSTDALHKILSRIIDGLDSIYIIIDSLDECAEREQTLPWIHEIISRNTGNLHLLVASRPERDILDSFRDLDPNPVDVAMEVNNDIVMYLDEQLSQVQHWDDATRETVKLTLTEGAQGMFRWIALQLSELKKCSSQRTVTNQLKNLPKGLYETYDRILLKIDHDSWTETKALLRFLCFAARPMTVAEISEVATINFDAEDGPQFDISCRFWSHRIVLEKCSGFIVESEGNIKLAHFSVKEYLLSKYLGEAVPICSFHLSSEMLAHSVISQTCLAYLLQFDTLGSLNMLESSHLALYAAQHWIFHGRAGDIDTSEPSLTLKLAKKLFTSNQKAAFINWLEIEDPERTDKEIFKNTYPSATPLYYACLEGLQQLSQYLINLEEMNVNAQGGYWGYALHAAANKGHIEVIRLLLNAGAYIHAHGRKHGYALHAAASNGSSEVVRLLLDAGADIHAQGGHYGYALHTAAESGSSEVVRLLLDAGAVIHAQGGFNGYALHAAASSGSSEVVRLLLEAGADIHAQGGHYGYALHAAASNGSSEVVRLLLDAGADIHAQSEFNGYALHAGASRGSSEVVRLLLDAGADIHAQGGYYGYALHAAALSGSSDVVRMLLDAGADIHTQGGHNGCALHTAASRGSSEVVRLLLDAGADIHAQDGYYGYALHAAASSGSSEVVKLLLDAGADIHAQGGSWGYALHAAASSGSSEVVRLLLDAGADIHAQGGSYGYALHAAASNGSSEVVKLLLDAGADIHAQGGRYGYALHAAASSGSSEVVKMLLDAGADVHAQGGHYGYVLHAAAWSGRSEVVKLLLDEGADIHAQGGHYGYALHAAASEGRSEVVRLLLNAGEDVNTQGGHYGYALHAAANSGHSEVVKLLLDEGADIHAQGGGFGYALQAAAASWWKGGSEVVKLLLDKGADVHAQGGRFGYALQAAAAASWWREGSEVVRLLLDKGADIHAQGGEYGYALHAAASSGSSEVVRLLLDAGADINAQGGQDGYALQAAAASWRRGSEVVGLLLDAGADVNAHGGKYGYALQAAASSGSSEVVRLLLDAGADIHAQGGDYGYALQAAASSGSSEVVRLLLDAGADIHAQGGWYGYALHAAASRGSSEVVKLLLDAGADVNAQGGFYDCALQAAAVAEEAEEVVELLLQHGAVYSPFILEFRVLSAVDPDV